GSPASSGCALALGMCSGGPPRERPASHLPPNARNKTASQFARCAPKWIRFGRRASCWRQCAVKPPPDNQISTSALLRHRWFTQAHRMALVTNAANLTTRLSRLEVCLPSLSTKDLDGQVWSQIV